MAEREVPGAVSVIPKSLTNRLQRQFSPEAPQEATDECWVTGIPYIRTHEGWL
ncbi:hypothetical protein O3S68_22060 [Kosakonia sp. SOY2]|uniref:hypothetical protein n=1 Tax=Kosakonia sp. SOY2 TaxID=3014557 RepID=UPI0022AC0F1C|nr:hypothetical protein [Kosakonia sp. SOY2]MCZ3384965.1 hypothetical protein [Kosakonia sp. SOY2]